MERGRIGRTTTRSEHETELLAFVAACALPCPLTDEPIGPDLVDALWPDQRLVVELDGRRGHQTTRAFEDDRARDRHLLVEGYRVARIAHRRLQMDQHTLAAQLRTLLEPAPTA